MRDGRPLDASERRSLLRRAQGVLRLQDLREPTGELAPVRPAVASDSQAGYSYAISPGFYKKGETAPRLARDPARWTANVQAMVASNAPWQLVTTFNEWGEGTSVESAQEWASPSGRGTYLDTLHRYLVGSTTPAPCNNPGTAAAHQKVVVFAFEDRTWSGVGGTQFDPPTMPYLHSLATQCATFADYTEPDTSQNSATQYVGTAAGNTANTVRDDCSPSSTCRSTQNNIFRQTRRHGMVPRSFVEGATAGCSASGNAAKHVGALYFFGTYTDGTGTHNDHDFCTSEVRPYSEFNPNALPDFSFVTPTLCNDGHDCGNATVDSWAAANVQPVLDSADYKAGNVTVFIWYDEDHPVPNMKIGLHVTAGVRTAPIDYRTELRTWEDLLGVPPIDTQAPSNARIVGLPLTSTTLATTINWTATDNTGVKSYDVRYRSAPYNTSSYSAYSTFKSATTATSGTFTGTAGRTYCFSVRARDANDNLGAYGPQSCVEFPCRRADHGRRRHLVEAQFELVLRIDRDALDQCRRDPQARRSIPATLHHRDQVFRVRNRECVPRFDAPQEREPRGELHGSQGGHPDRDVFSGQVRNGHAQAGLGRAQRDDRGARRLPRMRQRLASRKPEVMLKRRSWSLARVPVG